MFTKFCAQFIFVEILADELCPISLHPAQLTSGPNSSAGSIFLPCALDPPAPLLPNGWRRWFTPPHAFTSSVHLPQSTPPSLRRPHTTDASIGRRFLFPAP